MLVGVIADSHDYLPKLKAGLDLFKQNGVNHVLHAGDHVAPFAVKLLLASGLPFTGVFGNNDGEKVGIGKLTRDIHPEPHALELAGRRIVLVHDLGKLLPADRAGAEIVVFGHTHQPLVEKGPPLLLNPGECCGWLTGRCTVALLDLATLDVKILDI